MNHPDLAVGVSIALKAFREEDFNFFRLISSFERMATSGKRGVRFIPTLRMGYSRRF
jgi:hypothetical protein